MKAKITVYTLASDDDCGTKAEVFATEEDAVNNLLDAVGWQDDGRKEMRRLYFHPDELPEDCEDWYDLIREVKSDNDTYNIDEHTLTVELEFNDDGGLDQIVRQEVQP